MDVGIVNQKRLPHEAILQLQVVPGSHKPTKS